MNREALQRVQRTLDRLFPERQFYYRSEGVVHFFTLRKPAQMAGCGVALALAGWLLFASGMVLLRNQIIEGKNERIREVTAAYEALTQRSLETERRFLDITGEVEAQHRQLVALLDYRGRLERDIQELHGALERATTERDTARASIEDMRVRAAAAEQQLAAAAVNAQSLSRSLADAQQSTQALAQARDAALAENRALAGKMGVLTDTLRGAVDAEDRANRTLAETHGRLMQAGRERDAAILRGTDLEQQIADLTQRNAATTGRTTDLLRDLGRAEDQAVKVATERDEAVRSRDFLAHLVDELQFRLANLKDSQTDLVARLKERADGQVALAEAVIRQTGLDIDVLLNNAPGGDAAIGGPYVPLAYAGRGLNDVNDAFVKAVMGVEQQLDRWNAMEQLLAALPLAAPTDNYTLSSSYGLRIDPFTKKPAFHEGLDFAGPLNSAIKAPAPGVVTRVGYWGSYGLMVEIDHGFGITSRYGHLSKATVKRGQWIEFRQDLGTMGRSGRTTGPHLHYEVLFDGDPMDPANFLRAGRNVFKIGD